MGVEKTRRNLRKQDQRKDFYFRRTNGDHLLGNLGNEEMLFLASITKEMAATYETNHAEKGTRSENFRSVYGAVGLRPLNLSPADVNLYF